MHAASVATDLQPEKRARRCTPRPPRPPRPPPGPAPSSTPLSDVLSPPLRSSVSPSKRQPSSALDSAASCKACAARLDICKSCNCRLPFSLGDIAFCRTLLCSGSVLAWSRVFLSLLTFVSISDPKLLTHTVGCTVGPPGRGTIITITSVARAPNSHSLPPFPLSPVRRLSRIVKKRGMQCADRWGRNSSRIVGDQGPVGRCAPEKTEIFFGYVTV